MCVKSGLLFSCPDSCLVLLLLFSTADFPVLPARSPESRQPKLSGGVLRCLHPDAIRLRGHCDGVLQRGISAGVHGNGHLIVGDVVQYVYDVVGLDQPIGAIVHRHVVLRRSFVPSFCDVVYMIL